MIFKVVFIIIKEIILGIKDTWRIYLEQEKIYNRLSKIFTKDWYKKLNKEN